MKTYILNLLFISLLSYYSYGQKYYTLTNGNWNNTTEVWSLNGVTPCYCFPGNLLATDTLIINHAINLTADITASTNSIIQLNSNAQLSNIMYSISISGSQIISNGFISVEKLTINAGATLHVINSTLITDDGVEVYGTLIGDFSNLINNGDNCETFSTGTVTLLNDSRWQLNSGNYRSAGITNICATCCMYVESGNIQNSAGGSFIGSGVFITSNGNIRNSGIWDPNLIWCSSGTDFGMVSPENCILANDICSFVPLPTELIYFEGYQKEMYNELIWETASETNSDYFNLERSSDGIIWNIIGTVKAQGTSNSITNYSFNDTQKSIGINYYKLSQIDINGEKNFSEVLSIQSNYSTEIIVFPNPTDGDITIQLPQKHTFHSIYILDATGRRIKKIEIGDTFSINLQLPSQNGIYFIQAEGEEITTTYTMVKI